VGIADEHRVAPRGDQPPAPSAGGRHSMRSAGG